MKILTDNQKAVLRYLERHDIPLTISEIAADFNAPVSSVRSIVKALERHGAVERRGVSLSGGRTWAPVGRVVP